LPFRDAEQHLRDILESINNIDTFLGDMDFDFYRGDLKTKSAVERRCKSSPRLRFVWERMGDRPLSRRGLEGLPRYGEHTSARVPPN
jgi:hypothetical protein